MLGSIKFRPFACALALAAFQVPSAHANAAQPDACKATLPTPEASQGKPGWARATGSESWLQRFTGTTGTLECPYYEYLDLELVGDEAVCPPDVGSHAERVADFVRQIPTSKLSVEVVIDGFEDESPLRDELLARLTRVLGLGMADVATLARSIRSLRATARAQCFRDALSGSLPGISVTVGIPHVNQPTGRRGAAAIVIVHERPTPEEETAPPQRNKPVQAPFVPPPLPSSIFPGAVVKPRSIGLVADLGVVVAAESTHYWSPASSFGMGLSIDNIAIRQLFARVYGLLSFADFDSNVFLAGGPTRVHVQRYSLWGGGELGLAKTVDFFGAGRLRAGVVAELALVREVGPPVLYGGAYVDHFGASVGVTVSMRLLDGSGPGPRVDLRYRYLVVLSPNDFDVGVGHAHILGPALEWVL